MCKNCTEFSARPFLQNGMDAGAAAALSEKEEDWQARAEKATAQLHDALDEQVKLIKERDEARRHECSDLDAHWRLDEALASLKEANATVASLRTAQPLTDEMVERGARQYVEEEYVSWRRAPETVKNNARESVRGILRAALTEPARPEWADLADVISETTYYPEPDDLARALHHEGVRVVTEEQP